MFSISILAKLRGLSQSDLARKAGISRQAVSRWFASDSGAATPQVRSLLQLATSLELSLDDLLAPFPLLDQEADRHRLAATLNWDRLFPTLEDFLVALVRADRRALARLVESFGMFAAAKIMGKAVWIDFPRYARHLPPIRRRQCKNLWKFRAGRASI